MDEVPAARGFSGETVERMVRAVDPQTDVRGVERAERGFSSVYRVEVDGDGRPCGRYLKASPDGNRWGIPDEAHILAVLDANTSVPVPEVLGAVDVHDQLPTPFYLATELPGKERPYEFVARCEDDVLARLARETGEFLAELHAVDAVEGFGHVRREDPDLNGVAPSGDPATLTVGDAHESWPAFLRTYVDGELERHRAGRFSDLTPALSAWLEAGIDDLEGPFKPVIGRNDHGMHNLLVDPATGEITAMLDWGYTLAVPRTFDVAFAAYIYSGAYLAGAPGVPDRRPLVREVLLDGYRSVAPEAVPAISTPMPLYEAVAMLRLTNDFHHLDVPTGAEPAVADRLRDDVRALLEREPLG